MNEERGMAESFRKLMTAGKIRAALKVIEKNKTNGILEINEDMIEKESIFWLSYYVWCGLFLFMHSDSVVKASVHIWCSYSFH